jgi:hypothetical protein
MFRSGRRARDVFRSWQCVQVLLYLNIHLWRKATALPPAASRLLSMAFNRAVNASMLVLCVVTSCGLIDRQQRFEGTHCIHLQVWIYFVPSKRKMTSGFELRIPGLKSVDHHCASFGHGVFCISKSQQGVLCPLPSAPCLSGCESLHDEPHALSVLPNEIKERNRMDSPWFLPPDNRGYLYLRSWGNEQLL